MWASQIRKQQWFLLSKGWWWTQGSPGKGGGRYGHLVSPTWRSEKEPILYSFDSAVQQGCGFVFAWFCDFNLGLRLHESAASFTILAASHSQQRGICMIAFVICLFCWIVTYCNIASTATSKAFWDCSKGSYQSKSNLLASQPLAGTHCQPHPTTHHHPSLMIFDSCASGQTSKLAS